MLLPPPAKQAFAAPTAAATTISHQHHYHYLHLDGSCWYLRIHQNTSAISSAHFHYPAATLIFTVAALVP